MNGLVALLDPPSTKRVKALWSRLEHRFNLSGVQSFPYPHVSFNILHEYEPDKVEAKLRTIAASLKPFTIHTAGLGIFISPEPVIYIPVIRSPALDQVHQRLWQAFPQKADRGGLYAPEQWLPHITLAVDDLTREQLPQVLAFLSDTNFHWAIRLKSLTFAVKTETGYEFPCGCKFGEE